MTFRIHDIDVFRPVQGAKGRGIRFAVLGILAIALMIQPALAEERWSVELRGGAALPGSDVDGVELKTGAGFEGSVAYRLQPHLVVYGGWDWMRFPTDADVDLEETGYAFGLRFVHPLGDTSKLSYLLRGGLTLNHLEVENEAGDIIADSKHKAGFEIGAGLVVPIGAKWDLTPGVRYRSASHDVEDEGAETSVDLDYFAAEIGVSYRF